MLISIHEILHHVWLNHALAQYDWEFKSDTVQAYWDQLENQIIATMDELTPMV